MSSRFTQSRLLFPVLIVVILIAVYLPLILQQNDFRTDDYYLLTLIKQQGLVSPFDGIRYSYFSAFRIVPMLGLLMDYSIHGTNALGYYLFNLVLHIATVLLFFLLLKLIFRQFFDARGELLPLLLALALGLHADLFYNVLWICNRTEGLLLFFYLGAVYAWLRYFEEHRIRWYVIGLLSFFFALLSKEQAIHLPLLFLLIGGISMHRRAVAARWRPILIEVLPLVVMAASVFVLRWLYDPGASFMAGVFSPKKALSLIGINLIALHPTIAKPVFFYFVEHKLIAGIVGLLLGAASIFALYRSSRRTQHIVFVLVLIFIVTSFPRVFYHVLPRINSVQVAILLSFIGIALLNVPLRWMSTVAALLLLAQAIGMHHELALWRSETSNDRYVQLLKHEKHAAPVNYRLLTHYHDHARFIIHFLRSGEFGADSAVKNTPLFTDRRYGSRRGPEFDILQLGSRYIFRMNDPRAVFQYDSTISLPEGMTITLSEPAADYGFSRAEIGIGNIEPNTRYLIERNDAFERIFIIRQKAIE
jgi:hypothetical protein